MFFYFGLFTVLLFTAASGWLILLDNRREARRYEDWITAMSDIEDDMSIQLPVESQIKQDDLTVEELTNANAPAWLIERTKES